MTWTASDPRWQALNPYQRAAAMALMEADGADPNSARNALGAMINRATKSGVDLGEHVGQRIYQPSIEPAQQARLDRIMKNPAFSDLTGWAERRARGQEADPVQGATHFLAPEKTMLALEAKEPNKYLNWGPRGQNWTGYDPATGQYRGVVMRDSSHAFLAPEGAHSAPGTGAPKTTFESEPQVPQAAPAPAPMTAQAAPASPAAASPPDLQSAIMSAIFKRGEKPEQQQQAAPFPTSSPIPQGTDPRRQVDIKNLLAIVNNRSKLGV